VFGANILRRHSPLVTTTWAIVAGTLFIAPLGIAQLATSDLSGVGPPAVLAIVYSGTIAAGVATVVVFHGVKLLGPTRVSALQSLVPALAVVMAAVFLGEAIRPGQLIGGAVILAGIALLPGSPGRPTRGRDPGWATRMTGSWRRSKGPMGVRRRSRRSSRCAAARDLMGTTERSR
jgi:drug/metabolite transporter (DMT)-like permease